jgi:hypothetical protein
MKKQITLGLVVAGAVALLGAPAVANAAQDGSVTNPFSRTNGSIVNPYTTTNDFINPHSKTNGSVTNPFTRTN